MTILAKAVIALAIVATPAAAEFRLDYSPATNLEKLDVALVARARDTVDMAAYLLTDVPLVDALAAAGVRGVHVRVYIDPSSREPHGAVAEALQRLIAAPNVQERTKTSGALMHLKSFLVDDRILRGGAANFTASGLKQQDNDRFETDDAAAVAAFREDFDRMWER